MGSDADWTAGESVLRVVVGFRRFLSGVSALRRLHAHLSALPYSFRITVAENASSDGTVEVVIATVIGAMYWR